MRLLWSLDKAAGTVILFAPGCLDCETSNICWPQIASNACYWPYFHDFPLFVNAYV